MINRYGSSLIAIRNSVGISVYSSPKMLFMFCNEYDERIGILK